ncbi:MAG TPA: hypothetical protein VFV54_01070, partial [Thermoanaerobaculia bacterium]|nr:hypothetical protein [Thermoanaerobaculia bacterium]
ACKFTSNPTEPPNIVGVTQMVKDSAEEARAFVAELKDAMAESYAVGAAPALGEKAFVYRPKPGSSEAERSMWFVGHRQQVVVMGSMIFQKPITKAQREAGEALLLSAFALASDEKGLAAARRCSWFDAALVRKLLRSDDVTEQVFGASSCLANAGDRIVMLAVVESEDAETVAANVGAMAGGGCKSEPLADLGRAATLQHSCTEGNARAVVRFVSGARMFEVSLIPGSEPTKDDRALLIQLAKYTYAQSQ